jgi:hypothetical protein
MNGMNLEVWFPQQNHVTVFLESSFADPGEESAVEVHLFAHYACRQIANLGGEPTLCAALAGVDPAEPLVSVEQMLDDVTVSSPQTRGGARGFTAEFRPGPRFKLKGHGFGLMGKGVGYYAPTSTLALLCWLLRRRDHAAYRTALAATAATIGELGMGGMITVRSQGDAAAHAAIAGMDYIEESADAGDELGLSEEAEAAIVAHGIDFAEIIATARARLGEMIGDVEQERGSRIALPTEYCLHLCRMFIFPYGVGSADPSYAEVMKAHEALSAAQGTRNADLAAAAEAHYQNVLKVAIAAHGLEPLVPELNRRVFDTGDGAS